MSPTTTIHDLEAEVLHAGKDLRAVRIVDENGVYGVEARDMTGRLFELTIEVPKDPDLALTAKAQTLKQALRDIRGGLKTPPIAT